MSYTAEERDTIILTDDLTDTWKITTRQRKMITKIKKIKNVGVVNEEFAVGTNGKYVIEGTYELPVNQISFRNPSTKKELSEEEKQVLRDRLAKSRQSK